MLSIRDSVAVITGGSRGLGKALAGWWLRKGGKVINADVAEDHLNSALGGRSKIFRRRILVHHNSLNTSWKNKIKVI